jgi:mannose-6-phosphate isomerase
MWYILEAEPGAALALGFREPITRERLRQAAATGEIENLVNWIPVHPGETYFTPAHTVHAIGAGIVLCEIQQNSDVTYRLWDYGRPRPLHLEQAIPICDLQPHPGAARPLRISEGRDELVRSKHFTTELVRIPPGGAESPEARPCHLWIAIEGRGTIAGEAYRRGEVWLLPAAGEQPEIAAETASRFLRTWVPA